MLLRCIAFVKLNWGAMAAHLRYKLQPSTRCEGMSTHGDLIKSNHPDQDHAQLSLHTQLSWQEKMLPLYHTFLQTTDTLHVDVFACEVVGQVIVI